MTCDEIIEKLKVELCYIYCWNCKHENTENHRDGEHPCDWCYRKYMRWQPSDELLERIADMITPIHCKDCKYHGYYAHCDSFGEEGYCAWAERKDE